MRNVRWSDIGEVRTVEGEPRVSIDVSGKTGPRLVIANTGVETYLKRLRDFRRDELGQEPPSSEVVFCNRDGEPIHSFKKGFERVMGECGLLFQDNGAEARAVLPPSHLRDHADRRGRQRLPARFQHGHIRRYDRDVLRQEANQRSQERIGDYQDFVSSFEDN